MQAFAEGAVQGSQVDGKAASPIHSDALVSPTIQADIDTRKPCEVIERIALKGRGQRQDHIALLLQQHEGGAGVLVAAESIEHPAGDGIADALASLVGKVEVNARIDPAAAGLVGSGTEIGEVAADAGEADAVGGKWDGAK